MSTVSYEEFFKEVIPFVRDVPEFVALNAIRNACIEFCEETLFWRQVLDPMAVVVDQAEYDLEIEPNTEVAMIVSASLDDLSLEVKSDEELRKLLGANWREKTGGIQYVTQEDFATVRLCFTPDTATTSQLYFTVALRPLRSSTRIDRAIYERYAEIIGWGARARLHDTPQQSYSDENAAAKFRKWFESGYGKAKISINRGRGRGPMVLRPQRV